MRLLTNSRVWAVSAAALAASLWTGCQSTYEVKVDAISTPVAAVNPGVSYRLQTRVVPGDTQGLREQEAIEYVKTALSGRGMFEAPDPESADVVVELDYGMEAPRVRYERKTEPIVGRVGGGMRYEEVVVVDSKGRPRVELVPVYEPSRMDVVGYQDVAIPVVVYEKYLRLSARDNQEPVEGQPPAEVWSVHVSSEDESQDLRKYLPVLASASIDYIGRNSRTQQKIRIKENDEDVSFVRAGM